MPRDEKVERTFAVDCSAHLEIIMRPSIGAFRVLSDTGGSSELLHIADTLDEAREYRAEYPQAVMRIEEVTADEEAAAIIEGRYPSARPALPRYTTVSARPVGTSKLATSPMEQKILP